jgi:hypothetical protein
MPEALDMEILAFPCAFSGAEDKVTLREADDIVGTQIASLSLSLSLTLA